MAKLIGTAKLEEVGQLFLYVSVVPEDFPTFAGMPLTTQLHTIAGFCADQKAQRKP